MFNSSIYVERRRLVYQAMYDKTALDSALLIFANKPCIRNGDAYFPYRPSSSFFYLTGFEESEAALLLLPDQHGGESIFFCRPNDPVVALWDGALMGPDEAKKLLKFDQTYDIAKLEERIPQLLQGRSILYVDLDDYARYASFISQVKQLVALSSVVDPLRLVKDDVELSVMSEAASITVDAHVSAMQSAQIGMYEYALEATLLSAFLKRGGCPAYTSIVAGGANACVLHYIKNDTVLRDGDLVLIDAGCEYQYYASDVTRTFPVNGRFTEPQRNIYNVVLAAQNAVIEAVSSGVTLSHLHQIAVRSIVSGLLAIGLLQGDEEEILASEAYKLFFPHSTGHWLGLDVHDIVGYKPKKEVVLEKGMAFTVEPGIYISEQLRELKCVPEEYIGIGVRIEDDVVVEEKGAKVLTDGVPKEIEDIEALMRS